MQSQDKRTTILYAEELKRRKELESSHDKSLDAIGIGSFTEKGKEKYLDDLHHSLKLDVTEEDKRYLFVSEMDSVGKQSYRDCLEGSSKNVYIVPPDKSMLSDEFVVEVHLRGLGNELIPLTVDVTNGNFIKYSPGLKLGKNGTQLTGRFQPGAKPSITVSRNIVLPFNLTATAGKQRPESDALSLPAEPTVIKEELRFSKDLYVAACAQCNSHTEKALCINVPDDEVIVPGSERFEGYEQGFGVALSPRPGNLPVGTKEQYTANYKPHQSCRTIGYSIALSPKITGVVWVI